MPTWPATVPWIPIGARQVVADGLLVTEMDDGRRVNRQRFSSDRSSYPWEIVLTGTQYSALRTFYETDCSRGAASFTAEHPVTGSSVSFRFARLPTASVEAGSATAADRTFRVSIEVYTV